MQALLAFFFFITGLVTLAVSGTSVRLRLTVVVAIVAVMAGSGYAEGTTACRGGVGRMFAGEEGRAGDSRCCCIFREAIKGEGDR